MMNLHHFPFMGVCSIPHFLSPISGTQTFISSHVVMAVVVLGAPSGKCGEWG